MSLAKMPGSDIICAFIFSKSLVINPSSTNFSN